jgi:hypothetical protein
MSYLSRPGPLKSCEKVQVWTKVPPDVPIRTDAGGETSLPALPSPRSARFRAEARVFWQAVGKVLREEREESGLTRMAVIRRLGEYLESDKALSLPTLKRIEAGDTSPDGYLVALLCDMYDVPRAWPYRATQKQASGET